MASKVGYLPDIAKNFGIYKNMAVNYLNQGNHKAAESTIYILNGCLGDEYLVSINSEAYRIAKKDHVFYQCNHCTMDYEKIVYPGTEDEKKKTIQIPTEISINDVEEFDVLLSPTQAVLAETKTIKAWSCPSCSKTNKMSVTKRIKSQREKPFYLKVVPESPITHQAGMVSRMNNRLQFPKWFWNFLEEINQQELIYRKEYKNQNDGEDMGTYQDPGDKT